MRYDIDINGKGFYSIHSRTKAGHSWIHDNVPDAHRDMAGGWHAYSDSTNMTQDIADGAFDAGLRIRINGRCYLGNNQVAA